MKGCFLQKSILRFRRWSRAKYAAFCSLSRCISIGYLKASIADSSLKKSSSSRFCELVSAFTSDKDPEYDDGQLSKQAVLQIQDHPIVNIFIATRNEEAAAVVSSLLQAFISRPIKRFLHLLIGFFIVYI